MRKLISFCLLVLLCSNTSVLCAGIFNQPQAEKALEQVQAEYSSILSSSQSLQNNVRRLEALQAQAKECIKDGEKKLQAIQVSLAGRQPLKPKGEKPTAVKAALALEDITYLEAKKTQYAKELASCRLFLLRSEEVVTDYNEQLTRLSHYELMYRLPPAWELMAASKHTLAINLIKNPYFNLQSLTIATSIFLLMILTILAYRKRQRKPQIFRKLTYFYLLVVAGILTTFYTFSFVISPLYQWILLSLLSMVFFGLTWEMSQWLLSSTLKITLRSLAAILCTSLLALLTLGYQAFALYFLNALLYSFFSIIFLLCALHLIKRLSFYLSAPNSITAKKLHAVIGVRVGKSIFEMTLIKISLYVCLTSLFIFALLLSWHVPVNWLGHYVNAWFQGFSFSHVRIAPNTWIIATLAFVLLSISGRMLSVYILRHRKRDAGTQLALSSILAYISFAVALIVALFITGIDFTGIAIVAGALSIGVGLGLQTIVNNFVSGVILLLEKPIKPGDRIVVGDTEGFVKKIRIRSTQVTTTAHEDVIIPNSDLITGQIINYMFRDPIWRVTCKVGVVYGSDVALVEKSLINIAQTHSDVIQELPHKPLVLFRGFGDSALLFELWCVIRDVNKKYLVESELNFAIDQCFREKGIIIAFPQRDIHIKTDLSQTKPILND